MFLYGKEMGKQIEEPSFIAENKMETILHLITNVSVIFFKTLKPIGRICNLPNAISLKYWKW